MNRRTFLTTLSAGTLSGFAGCTALPFTDTPDDTSASDSDLDGVPDSDDYAPWDNAVQNKSDVLDDYWGHPVSPEDGALDDDPTRSMFSRETAPTTRSLSARSGATVPESMSTFVEYSTEKATVSLHSADVPEEPFRLLVVAREFPRRGVLTFGQSKSLTTSGAAEVTIPFKESLDSEENLYYSAFRIPDKPISELDMAEVAYLHETNPFQLSAGSLQSISTEYELEDVSGTTHTRTAVEGGYVISLGGRSAGHDWSMAYFVSRSAYELKRREPRGRRREEYVRYALSNGSGGRFVDVLTEAAKGASLSSRAEQAEFVIDVVQSLPYVLDSVGSGYDDYTKFVEETMVDIRGDCEDSTIALAVFLSDLGYDVVLVEFPSHIGIGLAGDHTGSYVTYEGAQYYYVETTSEGWGIGDIPEELDTSDIKVSAV